MANLDPVIIFNLTFTMTPVEEVCEEFGITKDDAIRILIDRCRYLQDQVDQKNERS
jgi:hypothetical protein